MEDSITVGGVRKVVKAQCKNQGCVKPSTRQTRMTDAAWVKVKRDQTMCKSGKPPMGNLPSV